MNYDEMPAGREMDVRVAEKVMKWHRNGEYPRFWYEGKTRVARAEPCDDYYQFSGTNMHFAINLDFTPEDAWCPSTDIAAALEVVEKVAPGTHGSFVLERTLAGRWIACFAHTKVCDATIEYDTAPHTICAAALKVAT